MTGRAPDAALLRSVTSVCAETIGEMIESREAAYAAADLGVTHGQDYLFGRPVVSPTLPAMPAPGTTAF